MGVLASYSITVKELKIFFSKLQGESGQWVSQSPPQRSSGIRNAKHLKTTAQQNSALIRQTNTDKSALTVHGSHGRRAISDIRLFTISKQKQWGHKGTEVKQEGKVYSSITDTNQVRKWVKLILCF